MSGRYQRRLIVVVASALMTAALLSAGIAEAAPPLDKVSFNTPGQFPNYAPSVRDYVVRCNDAAVTVNGHASGAWQLSIANRAYRRGDFTQTVALRDGKAFTATAKRDGSAQLYRYYVRCLPNDFPTYTYTRTGAASPRFFSVDEAFRPAADKRFAMIFNDRGVPVWWYRVPAWASRVLPSGNVLWWDTVAQRFEVHRLTGALVQNLTPSGWETNVHDLQFSGNGNYLIGANVIQNHVDTSAYGGSSDAAVLNIELRELSPSAQTLWSWPSEGHIALAETGHRWPWVINHAGLAGYDVSHWNSIEPVGNAVIASFRNLDAVYKIRKSTGQIVWKVGGTTTPESLAVENDPRGATLGAQHDARLLSNGTLTVFDNRTNLDNHKPRAVRFRIDEQDGSATLLESVTDPDITGSNCCGSAQRLGNGHWLIDWGQNRPIGGYAPDGTRTFLLTFDSTFSYRAEQVPSGAVSAADLRQAMDAIYAQSG